MEYRGRVQGGVVVLEPGAVLAEGTPVRVTAEQPTAEPSKHGVTVGQRLMRYAGALKGLPSDLARNHDHYIHGTPRK
jgi:hypothetical protein